MKKKKKIQKEKPKKKKSTSSRTNRTNRTVSKTEKPASRADRSDREYPELSPSEEITVLSYARGESLNDIAEKLNRGRSTIWDWLQLPHVKAALEKEREKVFSEAKSKTPKLVSATYEALLQKAKTGNFQFREGVQYLERTGYLQTTKDKEEENRKLAQLAEQLYSELAMFASEGDED